MKQKIFKKGITRRLFSVVLALAIILSLMPVFGIKVLADDYTGGIIYNNFDVSGNNEWIILYEEVPGLIALGDTLAADVAWEPDNAETEKCYVDGSLLELSAGVKKVNIGINVTVVMVDSSFDKRAIYLCSNHTESVGTLCDNCNPDGGSGSGSASWIEVNQGDKHFWYDASSISAGDNGAGGITYTCKEHFPSARATYAGGSWVNYNPCSHMSATDPTKTPTSTVADYDLVVPEGATALTPEQKAIVPTPVTGDTTTWDTGWYVVKGSVSISGDITVKGDVNLILEDAATLTMTDKRIKRQGTGNDNLTIWGQSSGTGKLTGTNTMWQLIGLDKLTINGGVIDVKTTSNNSHGIIVNDSVEINGGKVIATGGTQENYFGINAFNGITIHGGEITATGGLRAGRSSLIIDGGTVTAIRNTNNATALVGYPVTIATDAIVMAGDDAAGATPVGSGDISNQNYVKITVPPHQHAWVYSVGEGASANTLTATCTPDAGVCPQNKMVSLTLNASSPNYSGSTAPTLYTAEALKTWTDAGCPTPTFEYYESAGAGSIEHKAGATATTTFERGNYVAEATVGTTGNTATAKVAFNVTKKWTSDDYPTGQDYIDYSLAQAGDLWDENTAFGSSTTGFYVFKKETEMFFSDDGTNATGFTKIFISLTQKATTSTGNKYTFVADPRHKNWEYSVGEGTNANVLTAKCNAANHSSDDCYTTGVSLTLTASDTNYSGSAVTYGDSTDSPAKDIGITGYNAWMTAVESAPKVEFAIKGTTDWDTQAPQDPGDYTVRVYPDGEESNTTNTITKDFSIEYPIKVKKQDGKSAKYGEDYVINGNGIKLLSDNLIVSGGNSGSLINHKLTVGDYSSTVNSATLKDLYLGGDNSYTYIYANSGTPVLKIEGTNQIGSAAIRAGRGIRTDANSLTMTGSGSLTIYDSEDGIGSESSTNVTFDSNFTGTLTIDDFGAPAECAIGIGEGTLTVNNGTLNLVSDCGNGITAKEININGGTVTAQSNSSQAMSVAPTLGSGVKVEKASKIFDGSSPEETYDSSDINSYKYLKIAKTHTWTYSVNGATLTATCNRGCGASTAHTTTLTLTASSANYSGNAVKASISPAEKTAWEEADLTVPDIKYYGIGGTADPANNAAPTEIGKYTAKITPDNIVFATKDFEIIDPNAGGKVTIHRYLRPDQKDWLITCNEKEIKNLEAAGWKDEGALGFAGTKDTGVEVIRFYNEITGDRMYTSNEKEKQNYRDAKKYGWIEEGVAFYTGNKAKIVRYTTPTLSHLWSVSIEEQSRLDAHESEGWKKEGVAFYLN